MRASVCCRIRKDRVNKSGSAPVYLQVIINSDRVTIPLKISWPINFFDNTSGTFLERFKGDASAQDYNMLAQKETAKINEIFIYYRHSDFELNIEQFQKEFNRYGAKNNFLEWAELEIEERYKAERIAKQTRKNSLSNLKKIRKWKNEIRFSHLNQEMMGDLQAWLKNNQGLKINTVSGILKTVKVYARHAFEQGIALDMEDIARFRLPSSKSRVVFLKPSELKKLKKFYQDENIKPSHKRVLGQFLFSTFTGLRFSDIERVTWKEIDDDMLDFEPYKTRKIEKRVRIPLTENSFQYICNKKGKLFDTMEMQPTNRVLKDIAQLCGIRKNITTHVARHTFATEFLRRGGRIEVLQQLLGHSKIATTMIYAHVDEETKKEQMKLMEDF